MQNRGLILSLKRNINTIEELSNISNLPVDVAAKIINQTNNEFTRDELKKICLFFKVSAPYFLCQTEANNFPCLQLDHAYL